MEKIYLRNRYYNINTNYLEKLDENKWRLHVKNEDFLRIICKENKSFEDNDYFAVDPDGGPFMSIGYELNDDEKIKKIYHDNDKKIIIETEYI